MRPDDDGHDNNSGDSDAPRPTTNHVDKKQCAQRTHNDHPFIFFFLFIFIILTLCINILYCANIDMHTRGHCLLTYGIEIYYTHHTHIQEKIEHSTLYSAILCEMGTE